MGIPAFNLLQIIREFYMKGENAEHPSLDIIPQDVGPQAASGHI